MIDPDLTNKFFLESDSDQLTKIYQWARARYAAPWAVFGAVLARVAATTEPTVQLPGIIGGRASLNIMCAFVSASGGGKGISDKVAREAWPADIIERPIGSGEGIAETFRPPAKETEGAEQITRAIIAVPEIDTLAGLADKQGSILLATLKSAAMGELIGQANASKATTRIVQAHSYRVCMSVGVQYGHGAVIFNDSTGGTPQRFLWFPTTDPDMPAEAPADPEPLNTNLPQWARSKAPAPIVEITYGHPGIKQTVIDAHLARQRGDAEALDGHALLTRCKVAAAIAIMHHRSVVSEQDWALSATVMAVSDATRQMLLDHAREAAQAKIRDRAISRAVGEEVIDGRRLDVVKRRALKVLTNGRTARRDLMSRMGKREYRELLDSAIAELAADGKVSVVSAPQGGAHYELTPEFSAEPQFSAQNASSEALNREFSTEPSATVTDLDSRRSDQTERPKLSCPDWLAQYIAELRIADRTTVTTFAVYSDGRAEGYLKSTIGQAIDRNPDMVLVGSEGRSKVYNITGQKTGYKPAAQWVHDYLDALPANSDIIDKARFREAATAAGHTWEAAVQAIGRSGRITPAVDPTDSRATVWRIRPAVTEEGTA